ncbi:DUF1963 domain-containing protein [Flavobacterium sp. RHBU_24]|uniref:DUF1963 domain-containing protein n=1 Tax=Flavobacterium sp. RHBU_24 TaxID=3391185 RepID=UPI003984D7CE
MSFFKKISKLFSPGKSNTPNAGPLKELEQMAAPLLREATKMNLKKTAPPADSTLVSHFGGQPYFEDGMAWPVTKSGRPIEFIFQVFNSGHAGLPPSIKLVQFFYDMEEFPWDTEQDGWFVKIYRELDASKQVKIAQPYDGSPVKYCDINFVPVVSLPDWEGINVYGEEIADFCVKLNDDDPWEPYDAVAEKLAGTTDYQSQLGGYPNWVQGEATPKNSRDAYIKLLFQIDSEDEAGLMWGDVGCVYVFYDTDDDTLWLELQCH